MFGAFKPSTPLFGGLLWKIPWRMSPHQKLRHRRRLRRVDNIVATLDSALKRYTASSWSAAAAAPASSTPQQLPNSLEGQRQMSGKASPEDLATTAEGQHLLATEQQAGLEARRHGRGPRQGEMVPVHTAAGVRTAGRMTLTQQAAAAGTMKALERWKAEMPTEQEMLPRDKYTMFDRKARKYRKGLHKLPKWTRVSQRLNPPGF